MNSSAKRSYLNHLICAMLIALTLAAFWRVFDSDFIHYDDDTYVVRNSHVQFGLSSENVAWAFSTTRAGNWHPLTWLSHTLDCLLYGLNPVGHHLTNLLFHIANVLLLFLVLKRMTGNEWRSAFVAALFAIHPLHVESVAWVAERKDVLSTFFWMLTVLAYIAYVQRPGLRRYAPVIVLFALGLLAKPMLVTLPIVLLLLDYWPLGRFNVQGKPNRQTWKRLILEKAPLLALSAASSTVTFIAQRSAGSVNALESIPLGIRAANTLVACGEYLVKMFRPLDLGVLYPHPTTSLPIWQIGVAGMALAGISVFAVRLARSRSYILAGWLWYLVMLVPVIGIVQVGQQASADRYTYLPLVGVFIILAWGIPDLAALLSAKVGARLMKTALPLAACAAIALLAAQTATQVGYWHNATTLFEHTLAVTTRNSMMHYNLGYVLNLKGDYEGAVKHFTEALEIDPANVPAMTDLGVTFYTLGRIEQAMDCYARALKLEPNSSETHCNMGMALLGLGKDREAIAHFRAAIRIAPDDPQSHYDLGVALGQRSSEAISEYKEAIRLKPNYAEAHNNLAVALYFAGDYAQAWREVYSAAKCGFKPAPGFLQTLSAKMADPGTE